MSDRAEMKRCEPDEHIFEWDGNDRDDNDDEVIVERCAVCGEVREV